MSGEAGAWPDPVVPGEAGLGSFPDLAAESDRVPAPPLALEPRRPSRIELRKWWRYSKNGAEPHECGITGCERVARGEQRFCRYHFRQIAYGDDLLVDSTNLVDLAEEPGAEQEIDARTMDRAFDRVLRTR
jgi:ribosomal protein S14